MAKWRTVLRWSGAILSASVLLLAGTASVRLPHQDGPPPGVPGVEVPPGATAVLDAVRSALGPLGQSVPPIPPPEAVRPAPPVAAGERSSGEAPGHAEAAALAAPAPPTDLGARDPAGPPAPPQCRDVTVTMRSEPASVRPGDQFTWVLTVTNPNNRRLTRVSVVDQVSASPGIRFSIVFSDPVADSSTASTLTFDDVGPLGAGRSEQVRIGGRVEPGSVGGRLISEIKATGDCEGESTVEGATPVEGNLRFEEPAVVAVAGETLERAKARASRSAAGAPSGALSRTGGVGWPLPAAALLIGSVLLRRLARPR